MYTFYKMCLCVITYILFTFGDFQHLQKKAVLKHGFTENNFCKYMYL